MTRKTATATKKKKQKDGKPEEDQAKEWTKLMRKSKGPLTPYTPDNSFKTGDKISHPSFGNGYVERLSDPCKIWVIFENSEKLLVHKRTFRETKQETEAPG